MTEHAERTPPGFIDSHGLTDTGKKRRTNQDQFLVAELSKSMLTKQSSLDDGDESRHLGGPQGQLFLVADGMGGHAAGDRASSIAVDTVMSHVLNMMPWFFKLDSAHGGELREELRALFDECQAKIEAAASRHAESRGMGTTLTMAYVLWPNVYVVHVGDSRCYLLRDERLEQITTDHTLAQQLVDAGRLAASDAEDNRLSHVLWNALGGADSSLRPDVYRARLDLGDALLLATDGLTKHVSDTEILECLQSEPNAEAAARRLVRTANDAGGTDNVTVVVARFEKSSELASLGEPDELVSSQRMALPRAVDSPLTPREACLKNLEAEIEGWRGGGRRDGRGGAAPLLENASLLTSEN